MSIKVKDQLIGLKPYKPGKTTDELKRELGLDRITKLASNENPFGCSEKAKEAISAALNDLAIYPDGYALDLRQKLADLLHVELNQLLFGSGSDEIIQMISRSILRPGTNTVMANPTFPQFKNNALIEGIQIKEVDCINGHHDLDGMLNKIDENTSVVWVCTPNNPTGVYINEEKLVNFIKQVPENVLVVIDEAYYEYLDVEDAPDVLSLLKKYPNLILLRTFSKGYGLASLRIGYAVGQAEIMQAIDPARLPFNANRLGQKAAIAALDDQEFIQYVKKQNQKGLEQFYRFCEKYKLTYFPSQANFILIDFNRPGNEVFEYLLQQGFIVRSGEALGYPTGCRITIGTEKQNAEIIEVLSNWLDLDE